MSAPNTIYKEGNIMRGNKNDWIKFICCFIYLIAVFGCAGPSLREQSIVRGLPEIYRNHNSGFIISPSKDDINHAVALGKTSANGHSLTYAYLIKGSYDLMSNSDVYVRIATPLYLIAEHAKEQSREYKDIDTDFVDYCMNMDAIKISLTQQYVSDQFTAYPFQRQIILLRDGKRIEPMNSIKSFKGLNPFALQQNKDIQNIIASYQRMAPSQSFTMTQEQLEDLEKTYRSTGYSESQINTYMSAVRAGANLTKSSGQITVIPLLESDAVYKTSELKKPGMYEIVFRTPSTNNLIVSGDKEIRFPINFNKFR